MRFLRAICYPNRAQSITTFAVRITVAGCVAHFKKMLYDNAQLARVYLHAWQVTGVEFYRTITEETLDYVVREMLDDQGGFCSTQGADSEVEEGEFFLWTADETRSVLEDDAGAAAFVAAYGVAEQGNLAGGNTLEFVGDVDQRLALAEARPKLFQAREKRVHPDRDDKVLTSAARTQLVTGKRRASYPAPAIAARRSFSWR